MVKLFGLYSLTTLLKHFWKNNGNSIISGVDLHTRKRSGEDKYYIEDSNGAMTISWQYYLQVMVLEEDKLNI